MSVAPALAQMCLPPGGLGIQQWYGICAPALQQAYAMGMGQGAPFQVFVQAAYQVYAQSMSSSGAGMQTCELGTSERFSGYTRT